MWLLKEDQTSLLCILCFDDLLYDEIEVHAWMTRQVRGRVVEKPTKFWIWWRMTFSIRNLSSEFLIHFFSNSKLSWEPHYKIQPSHQEKAWIWPRVFKSKQTNCVLFLPLVTAPLDAMPSFSNLSNFFSSEGSKALELILTMPSDNVILSWSSFSPFLLFSIQLHNWKLFGIRE